MITQRLKNLLPKRVRVFNPEEVTTKSEHEVDPRAVGLQRKDVEAIWSSVRNFYRTGFHPALGLCIRRRGEVILDRAIGHASGNSPKDPRDARLVKATPKTLFNFFSGSKVVTAMLTHLLTEREHVHVDEPVATFIPEFARKGKGGITLRDVLTHRAGIPEAPTDVVDLELLREPERIVEMICDLEPTHEPGTVPAYHAVTGGFILAEVIQRVTRTPIRDLLDKEITEPLGLSHFNYGVPQSKLDDVAIDAFTGPVPRWPLKDMLEKALGLSMPDLIDTSNDPRFRMGVVPSANIMATPDGVCRFFELLLCNGTYEGTQILEPATVQRAIAPQTAGQLDRVLMMPIAYSMGFMLGTDPVGLYGPRCGRAFGHLGLTNVLGWADPDRDISVGFMNTGKPLPSIESLLWFDVIRNIAMRIPRDGRLPSSGRASS